MQVSYGFRIIFYVYTIFTRCFVACCLMGSFTVWRFNADRNLFSAWNISEEISRPLLDKPALSSDKFETPDLEMLQRR